MPRPVESSTDTCELCQKPTVCGRLVLDAFLDVDGQGLAHSEEWSDLFELIVCEACSGRADIVPTLLRLAADAAEANAPEVPAEKHEDQQDEQHDAQRVSDAVTDGRAEQRQHDPHEQKQHEDIDQGHGAKLSPERPRAVYVDVDCQHLKGHGPFGFVVLHVHAASESLPTRLHCCRACWLKFSLLALECEKL